MLVQPTLHPSSTRKALLGKNFLFEYQSGKNFWIKTPNNQKLN